MTKDQKNESLKKLSDAYNAGYINAQDYLTRSQAVNKAYYAATYGEFDLSDMPGEGA
jgi:hypothetical protein